MENSQVPSPGYALFLSLVASVVRAGVVFLLGRFGVTWSEEQLGSMTTWIASAVVVLLVLAWSMVEKRVLLHTQPPAPAPAPETSDEKRQQSPPPGQ